ncbi:MAG: damage-inducible protein CinA [Gammaproteobacteria bacterium]|nr:damage-inducible protein CinA [Gammaproteobacteria bacterium]|tara:strand:- start:220 stop:795 length:576 start_codon:yes stop_codon:yes gene_type:complete
MDKEIYELAQQTGQRLVAQGLRMATAESCTGGWIAQAATAVPGSSHWFDTGLVTYSNQAKQHFLEVPGSYFAGPEAPGAVSRETVEAMSRGILAASGVACAVATSGIAGPDGGSIDKPVGTVWIAWALKLSGQSTLRQTAQRYVFTGDREAVRRQSVIEAYLGLLRLLDDHQPGAADGSAAPFSGAGSNTG